MISEALSLVTTTNDEQAAAFAACWLCPLCWLVELSSS